MKNWMSLRYHTGFAFIALFVSAPAWSQSTISVVVNEVPVVFSGTPPTEINGSVLVPLRGVFQQLGASVDYNASTQQIISHRGNTVVALTLGQRQAFVNGIPQNLAQPPQVINGTTLVPLRFVAESFGADVAWLPATQTVEINTSDQHLDQLPSPRLDQNGNVVGTLTGIFQNTTQPRITLRVAGENSSIPVNGDTVVVIQSDSGSGTQCQLADLKIGDQVRVTEGSVGAPASLIRVRYGQLVGEVKSVESLPDGTQIITLTDGQSRQIARNASILMAGRSISSTDISPADHVTIRTDPDTKIAYELDVHTQGGNTNTVAAPTPSGSLTISSFTISSNDVLKAGDSIGGTLRGTPGQKAVMSIPGIVDSVPLNETTSGLYEGAYTVPKGANIKQGSVMGRLIAPGTPLSSAPLVQASKTVTIDTKAPYISGVSPAENSTTANNRPAIYAVFSDPSGTGVNAGSTRIKVDGAVVTSSAVITSSFITYQPSVPFSNGVHKVEITTNDYAVNGADKLWVFTVAADEGIITGFKSNYTGQTPTIGAGDTLLVTLKAQPGGRAKFSVGKIATDIPMTESSPGVYTGKFVPLAGNSVQSAPVVAQYTSPTGSVVTSSLNQSITINAGPPHKPVITSPTDGQAVGDNVTVTGTAQPKATINISITYTSKAFGLIPTSGKAADTQVTADANGNWTTPPLAMPSAGLLTSSKDTVYDLSATCVDAAGQTSSPAMVSFKHG